MKNEVGLYVELFDFRAFLSLRDAVKLLSLYKNLDRIGVVQTLNNSGGSNERNDSSI